MKILAIDDEMFALRKLVDQLNEIEFVEEVKGFMNPFEAIEAFSSIIGKCSFGDMIVPKRA